MISRMLRLTPVALILILWPVLCNAQYSPDNNEQDTVNTAQAFLDDLDNEEEKLPRIVAFDFDSLLHSSLFTPRRNLFDEITRSFYHDAGDMLKSNPSNKVTMYQNSPVRTTVSPFALPGNRINVIFDGRQLNPIEHIVEPDNRIDFNDIPIEHAKNIYNIEGPLGLALGGNNATSSMVILPFEPDTSRIESRLVVDKGKYGYAYTKAMLAHRNEHGRLMRLSLGYRKADGVLAYRNDNSNQQYYELEQPLFRRMVVKADVRLYRRKGTFSPRADFNIFHLDRDRRDRDISLAVDLNHDSLSKSSVSFRYQRSESILNNPNKSYSRYVDNSENGMTFFHYRKLGRFKARFGIMGAIQNFNDKDEAGEFDREHGKVDLLLFSGNSQSNFTLYAIGDKVGDFDPVPSGSAAFSFRSGLFSFSASVGYATIFPRLYDLYLAPKLDVLYSGSTNDYYESGNESLQPEKQMIGNVFFGIGSPGTELTMSVTGGKITDAIDWVSTDTLDLETGGYRPINHDIDFVNGTIKQKISVRENIYWSGGGSYHFVGHDDNDNPPYTPEYQAFTNLELYYYVVPLELHLFAYGEFLYSGPYTGLNGAELGEEPVFNVKLSFQIKKFRFYYLFQNMLNRDYQDREDYYLIGRNNYYGITWEFLD